MENNFPSTSNTASVYSKGCTFSIPFHRKGPAVWLNLRAKVSFCTRGPHGRKKKIFVLCRGSHPGCDLWKHDARYFVRYLRVRPSSACSWKRKIFSVRPQQMISRPTYYFIDSDRRCSSGAMTIEKFHFSNAPIMEA